MCFKHGRNNRMGMIQEREIDVAGKGRIAGDTVFSNDKC